ncbi:unnamed protein product [Dovyalis caffra]|uniref:Uncharacterized protein n=1 Tax=Dovyalis caffra TaxID=77055 RepID=A0AAV1RVE2_9ROSI|nr:unnamed protein product [Dovyalis caffra]
MSLSVKEMDNDELQRESDERKGNHGGSDRSFAGFGFSKVVFSLLWRRWVARDVLGLASGDKHRSNEFGCEGDGRQRAPKRKCFPVALPNKG